MKEVDVIIIGAGTAGLNAMAQVRRAGKSFVLINGGDYGTTCARVGCMPSKALIQIAEDLHRRQFWKRYGIQGAESASLKSADALEHVRGLRDNFVERVTSGSTDNLSAEQRIDGYAEFVEPQVVKAAGQAFRGRSVVVATGSSPIVPAEWQPLRDRLLTTDELFDLEQLPESMAVIGLGVIGLELGQALHRLGVTVTGADRLQTVGGLSDPIVNAAAVEILGRELPLRLGVEARLRQEGTGIGLSLDEQQMDVERVLVSVGRSPNIQHLRLDRLGVELDERGVPAYDPATLQVAGLPVFIAGDVNGDRPVLHEAGDEGKIAGYNAVQEHPIAFRRKTRLSITFCDPNIAEIGAPWSALAECEDVVVGEMRFTQQGRALIMGANRGILRVYAQRETGKLLGAALAAPRGEHLAHLLAWSIEMGLGVEDLACMPYYHPVIEEGLQGAVADLIAKIKPGPPEIPPGLKVL